MVDLLSGPINQTVVTPSLVNTSSSAAQGWVHNLTITPVNR
jgi:hypothetical protein